MALTIIDTLRAAGLVALAAVASPVSQASLAPSFGAIPSGVNHERMILLTFSTACLMPFLARTSDLTSIYISKLRIIWVFWIPVLQQVLLHFHEQLGPIGGPIVGGFLSCHVVIILAGYGASSILRHVASRTALGGALGGVLMAGLAVPLFLTLERTISKQLHSMTNIMSLVLMQLLQASLHFVSSPTLHVWLVIPAIAQTLFFNPHLTITNVNHGLAPHNWTSLERAWSNTGYISVLENHADGYRVLRCDHSLLGGEWILTPVRQSKEGWRVNEPTYAVFEMLEAVRLIERDQPLADSKAQALVVGLGIGTAPKALIQHGIKTTIVELDPVVHDFAVKHFGLPTNHTAIIQDATTWVAHAARNRESEVFLYDYIIHDVFTGGASPLALFTASFLQDLRALLHPDGVIAINYAGDLSLPLTRHILRTIEAVFDGRRQCRIFRDHPPPPPAAPMQKSKDARNLNQPHAKDADTQNNKAKSRRDTASTGEAAEQEDFLNMVVFCRNNPESGPIRFRKPVRADYLNSRSRQYYLLPKDEHEIDFPKANTDGSVSSRLLEVGDERLWSTQQIESAIRHWHIMRKVVPNAVWDYW